MSTVAVGPALRIDGPSPEPRPYSLLETPGVVVSRDEGRWLNGVAVEGYPSSVPSLWEPCSDGTFRVKDEGEGLPSARFDSVAVYLPVSCSAIGLRDAEEVLARKAEDVNDATLSYGVEELLSQGVELSINPFFGDTNLVPLGGGAVTPDVGLSWLEDAIGGTGRAGMIHATPAVIAAWGFDKLETGAGLTSTNGTRVVSGGGYIGADPVDESTPAAGQAWAFATGPVEVYIGPEVITTLAESLDRETNDIVFRAERYVVAEWDTALQVGVLIDWTP